MFYMQFVSVYACGYVAHIKSLFCVFSIIIIIYLNVGVVVVVVSQITLTWNGGKFYR